MAGNKGPAGVGYHVINTVVRVRLEHVQGGTRQIYVWPVVDDACLAADIER
jgi:hypothetical protein